MDEDVKEILCRHREHLEKTVSSLKMKLAKSAEEHDKVYVKLMKVKQRRGSFLCAAVLGQVSVVFSKVPQMSLQENVTLITEINELRKELLSLRSSVKPPRGTIKKVKGRPKSADVH